MSDSVSPPASVDAVVKLGGCALSEFSLFEWALSAIGQSATVRRLLIVPGGGAFADAVRQMDDEYGLSDSAAHWMAVAAMDQAAYLIADRMDAGVLVRHPEAISEVIDAGRVPVLAPSEWLLKSDPLPHSWDVTSDSIAAWVAGQVCASDLVLIKPPGVGIHRSGDMAAPGLDLVDAWFRRALPEGIAWTVVGVDQVTLAFDARSRSRRLPA